jgi:protein-tyrosine-phosphatase
MKRVLNLCTGNSCRSQRDETNEWIGEEHAYVTSL